MVNHKYEPGALHFLVPAYRREPVEGQQPLALIVQPVTIITLKQVTEPVLRFPKHTAGNQVSQDILL